MSLLIIFSIEPSVQTANLNVTKFIGCAAGVDTLAVMVLAAGQFM